MSKLKWNDFKNKQPNDYSICVWIKRGTNLAYFGLYDDEDGLFQDQVTNVWHKASLWIELPNIPDKYLPKGMS